MFSDFGFSQSLFSGHEQGEGYRVPVKFFSGGTTTGFFSSLSLDLSGTASKYDIKPYDQCYYYTLPLYHIIILYEGGRSIH